MPISVVTWNINGIKARHDTVLAYLRDSAPDVVCLQEIKSRDETFPRQAFEDLGYNVETFGQKSFNGVALLSKVPVEEVERGLPGDPDDVQARFIAGTVVVDGIAMRVASLYLPNGNPINTGKFSYKLAWMERLIAKAEELLTSEIPFVLAGDYNVIPMPIDAAHPENWTLDALFQPESRRKLRRLMALGLTDAIRASTDDVAYTFWDYQAGAWQKNDGIRIDHLMMSPQATDLMVNCGVHAHVRAWEKPSDHVPVWACFDMGRSPY